jgi:hypothetical protein
MCGPQQSNCAVRESLATESGSEYIMPALPQAACHDPNTVVRVVLQPLIGNEGTRLVREIET